MISIYNSYIDEIIKLTDHQKEQLYDYYELLRDTSKVMNLTTITEEIDVYIKHFYDSILTLINEQEISGKTFLDIGSGAGFPGLVLKIVYPNLDITLLEPTKKRCDFLNTVITKLNLQNIKVVNERAEDYIKNAREIYDFVSARAVANLSILSELALAFVKNDGYFLSMKGQNFEEEIKESKNALIKLGGKIDKIYEYNLPKDAGVRAIIRIKKVKKTPLEYPRAYAKIKKKPL